MNPDAWIRSSRRRPRAEREPDEEPKPAAPLVTQGVRSTRPPHVEEKTPDDLIRDARGAPIWTPLI